MRTTICCKITQRHAAQFELTVRGQGKSGDAATGGNAIDPILKLQCEPEVAIRPGRNVERLAPNGELGDGSTGGDAPDLVSGHKASGSRSILRAAHTRVMYFRKTGHLIRYVAFEQHMTLVQEFLKAY